MVRAEDDRAAVGVLEVTGLLVGELGDGMHRRPLHGLVDRRRADVERPAEDVGEAEDVVDLIGEIRPACADHGVRAHLAGEVGHDLRRRIGERHDHRPLGHRLQKLRLQHAAGREPEEDVRPLDHFRQRALVRLLGIDRLVAVHQLLAADVDEALEVADPDVVDLGAERDQQVEAGERRRTRTRGDDLDRGDVLAGELEPVEDRRRDDDRRAVLVVVEDRDLHLLAQLTLDLETLGRLDVLEVDAAEGRLQRRDDVDHALDRRRVDLDVEDVDAGELLEEDGLALHHRLGGERPDVAETEHRRAVGDDGDEIAARGVVLRPIRIVLDRQTGRRDARRIGERQVALVAERLGRLDLELSGTRHLVEIQRGFRELVVVAAFGKGRGDLVGRLGRHRSLPFRVGASAGPLGPAVSTGRRPVDHVPPCLRRRAASVNRRADPEQPSR